MWLYKITTDSLTKLGAIKFIKATAILFEKLNYKPKKKKSYHYYPCRIDFSANMREFKKNKLELFNNYLIKINTEKRIKLKKQMEKDPDNGRKKSQYKSVIERLRKLKNEKAEMDELIKVIGYKPTKGKKDIKRKKK